MSRQHWNHWIADLLRGQPGRRARRGWRGAHQERRRLTRGIEPLENRVVLSTAPVVTTGSAESVYASGATLIGTVNSEGSTAIVHFQYSTTSSFAATFQTTFDSGFNGPLGVAVDSAGDVFVADSNNNAVKEIRPDGSMKRIGSGFNNPAGVAVDAAGDVFVADFLNDAVKEVLPNGSIKTIGSGFDRPNGVAIDATGDVFVADFGNDAVEEVFANGSIKTIGSGFSGPEGVAVDSLGDVFVADTENNVVKEVLPNGTIKDFGSGFSLPAGVAVDSLGDVLVAVAGDNAVKEILPNGSIKSIGSGFSNPNGVTVDATGDVFVADSNNNAAVELSPSPIAATPSSLNGSSAAAVTSLLTGLVPGTDYYFRLVASWPGGTVVGQTVHFATPNPPDLSIGSFAVSDSLGLAPIAIAPAATLSSGDGAFAKASLAVVDTNYAAYPSDQLSVGSSGRLVVSGTSLVYGGATVGNFTGAGTGTLTITFNDTANEGAILATVRNVMFASAPPGSRSIQFRLTDGSGNLGTPETKTVVVALPATAVATAPASDVSQSGATLDGAVDPQGTTVAASFQYSTGPNFIPSVQSTVLAYAGFGGPVGVALDSQGDLFVADSHKNAVEEVFANSSIKTIGSGFNSPQAVAVDAAGDVFVADFGTNSVKEVFPNGSITTIGSGFTGPEGVAVDAAGDVFVADFNNNAVKEVLPDGGIRTIGSGFNQPADVAVDANGDVFVADYANDAVKEVLPNGIIKIIGTGFAEPSAVKVDAAGDVFVADYDNNAVKEVFPNGIIKTIGSGFSGPSGVAVDAAGDVFVADYSNNAVKEVFPNGSIKTIGSSFSNPVGITVDTAGDVFRADQADQNIKEFLPDGSVKTIGSRLSHLSGVAVDASGDVFVAENSGDNFGVLGIYGVVEEILPSGTVRPIGRDFDNPTGLAVDAVGDVFVADSGNNAVDEVLPGGTILTIGSGFDHPSSVAVDAAGDVFVANTGHNTVKEVLPNGSIKSIGYGFTQPTGVAVDAFGDVFVSDTTDNDVKEVLPDGTVTTIGSSFNKPAGVAVDAAGDLYVLETAIVKFSPPTVAATPATVSGTNLVAVSAALTGLSPDTHYWFRLLASSAGGTFFGQTVDFITPPAVSIAVQQISYAIGGVAIAVAPAAALATGDGGFANTSLSIVDTNAGATDQLTILASSGATTATVTMPTRLANLDSVSSGGLTIAGSTLIYNFTDIGTFAGGQGTTPLVINFTSGATETDVLAVLQSISFDITNLVPSSLSSRQVTLQFANRSGISTPVTQTISFSNVISTPATFSGDTVYALTGTYLYNNPVTIENGGAGSVTLDDPSGDLIFLSTVDSSDGSELTVSAASVQFYANVGASGPIKDLAVESGGQFALGANITTSGNIIITTQPGAPGEVANLELQPGAALSAGGQVKLLSFSGVSADAGSTITAGSVTIYADFAAGQFNNSGAAITLDGAITSPSIVVQGGSDDPLYVADNSGASGTETANSISGYGLTGTLTYSGVQPAVAAPYNGYVEAVFNDVLGRSVDPAGLQYWTQQLASGVPISTVAQDIVHSAEYFQKFVISPDYLKLLGRPADALGLQYWTPHLQNGMTDQELESDLVSSQEFYANAGGTNTDWVNSVFQRLLGRPVDTAGLSFWNGELSQGMTLSQAAMGIANSTENNAQLINVDYLHYLGRPADSGGLEYWLQQFGTGATNEDVIAGFTGSTEYFEKANGIKSS